MNKAPQQTSQYWFKRRRYGYGWTPVTWQGWITFAIFLLVIVVSALIILPSKPAQPTTAKLVIFFLFVLSDLLVFIGITLAKGPNPRWRWGKKSSDNAHEDF